MLLSNREYIYTIYSFSICFYPKRIAVSVFLSACLLGIKWLDTQWWSQWWCKIWTFPAISCRRYYIISHITYELSNSSLYEYWFCNCQIWYDIVPKYRLMAIGHPKTLDIDISKKCRKKGHSLIKKKVILGLDF